MAGNGPLAKDQHQRERNTKRHQADTATVSQDDEVRGPDLEGDYLPQTHRWYNTWRTSPQAQLFETTDWLRLILLASLVNQYFVFPTTAALAEIRLNEERLGALYADRQRAKIRITPREQDDETPSLAIVSSADDARARMRGGV